MTKREKILKDLKKLEQKWDAEEKAGKRCPYCGSTHNLDPMVMTPPNEQHIRYGKVR